MWRYRLLTYFGLYVISFSLIVTFFGERGVFVNSIREKRLEEENRLLSQREMEMDILFSQVDGYDTSVFTSHGLNAFGNWLDEHGSPDEKENSPTFEGFPLWLSLLLSFIVPTLYLTLALTVLRNGVATWQERRSDGDRWM